MTQERINIKKLVLDLFAEESEGLGVDEVTSHLNAKNVEVFSPRGVRNLVKRLTDEKELIKRKRKVTGPSGRGAPSYIYVHKKFLPQKFSLFDETPGIKTYRIQTKADIERSELDLKEMEILEKSRSVLEKIAEGHLLEDRYARAIINIARELAEKNPIDLIIAMAEWVVEDLNRRAVELQLMNKRGEFIEANIKANVLDFLLERARRYFQTFWRLERYVKEFRGIMNLPSNAQRCLEGECANLDKKEAREQLKKRIIGNRVIEEREVNLGLHKAAAGTDASIADIYFEHRQGSFISADPLSIITGTAALITRSDSVKCEFHDFNICPDRLREYPDHRTTKEGFIFSSPMKQTQPERDFNNSRMAAMNLLQYYEDFRIATQISNWRPTGSTPSLGIPANPTIIFRDGRAFPLMHSLNDYEHDGSFGKTVRNEIAQFSKTVHNALSGPGQEIVYGAVVKNHEISCLAPLVFWYLYDRQVKLDGKDVIEQCDDIYLPPLCDTEISHLLFIGMAKKLTGFPKNRLFITFRALRRFSDIAMEGSETMPLIISKNGQEKLLDEDEEKDWWDFIDQHIGESKKYRRETAIDRSDYGYFIYLCAKVGVSMYYAAPVTAYKQFADSGFSTTGHFLLPRLETAILTDNPDRGEKHIESILSWMATDGCELDHSHRQSRFNADNQKHSLPLLVPDVVVLAHEAATFARDKMNEEEIQAEIRPIIERLRKQFSKR